ncbi:MAG: nucleotidyl transferase AbiEii/AbiGii toxin family protein [Mediterranea sp.]|nr:nucleotidyl transferase AbiEii/AbiGii toxin family protein [Mediterranea sp.]
MLSFQTVESHTLELLKQIMTSPLFTELRLVGGTALALQLGHRKSIDLDLFGRLTAENKEIKDYLSTLGKLSVLKESENIKTYTINGVKIDLVNYSYAWIDAPIIDKDIRLASMRDIAAMKINAIEGRDSRKDFVDIYFLLQHFSLSEVLSFYMKKYPEYSILRALMSLTYFEDANQQISPQMLIPVDWTTIQTVITDTVKAYK